MTDLFQDNEFSDPIIDENKDYLSELVGEGKKFSDPSALARGKYEADQFVERLKQENQGLRNELTTRVKMEEFLDKLNSIPQQPPKSPEGEQQPPVQPKEGLKPDDVIKLLDAREQQKIATTNVSKVKDKLQESLGPNYANKLKQVANTLGLSTDHLNNLAATSPEAFYKLVGIEAKREQDLFQSPPRTQMSMTFQPKGQHKDWAYFQEIKKKDVNAYFAPAVQNEMHELRKKGLLKIPGED